MIVFTRQREIWCVESNLGTIRAQLCSDVLTLQSTTIMTADYSPVSGVTVEWAPSDGYFPIVLVGVTGGPCAPPVYFYAADGGDLTVLQIELLVQQLGQLPGTKNRVQPQQLDPSVLCGQADPVGIVSTPYRFPNIQG